MQTPLLEIMSLLAVNLDKVVKYFCEVSVATGTESHLQAKFDELFCLRDPISILQIRTTKYQSIPQSSNFTFRYIVSLPAEFEMQQFAKICSFSNTSVAKFRFSQCSYHRMVSERSNFECYRQQTLLCLAYNVYKDPLAKYMGLFRFQLINRWTGDPYVKKSKGGL